MEKRSARVKPEKVRVGIVGCGQVTQRHHLPALRHVSEIEVVALADAEITRAEKLAKLHGINRACASHQELLAIQGLDAVAVCVPPQLHCAIAIAALESGKHLFIEKPLALNLAECDALIEASQRDLSRKVMVGFNLRWHRLVRQAWNIIDRGELGAIKLVRTVFIGGKNAGTSPWRNSPGTGGNVIFDLGVHHFDLVQFLLRNEVGNISASRIDSDNAATISFSMRNGAQVECVFAEGTAPRQSFEICGERGSLRVCLYRCDGLEQFRAGEKPDALSARLRAAKNTLFNLPRTFLQSRAGGEYAGSYVEQWNQFAESILLDQPAEADLFAGRRALEIALAASSNTK